ncbi:L,D-transpeptidase family protein [Candidatus Pelagibacter sp.]|uniref:L,D-transpeptidase family protein n=1 Tax=Candidatus Pelagibacter sp. TaxID=2024849 RepID=UPI003F87B617
MNLILKNNNTLLLDDFKFKCVIGKNGKSFNKKEGDLKTPKGTFSLGPLFYRKDKITNPRTKLSKIPIKKNMGWCDDADNKFYNKPILIDKKIRHEKMFRNDDIYNLVIVINYNTKNIIKNKGSAIFIHLTNNYKKTRGCIALKENDMLVLLKMINKNTKIKIV